MYNNYLPLISKPYLPEFGVQIDGPLTIPIKGYRLYHTNIRIANPEPWYLANIEAFEHNPYILDFKVIPQDWRIWPGRPGSPPKPEYYDDYIFFILETIAKIDGHALPRPWGIEIFNEPAVENYLGSADNPKYETQIWYGAWVENGDYRKAGLLYGDVLATVYPSIHALGINVLGGVLVDGSDNQLSFLSALLETGQLDYVSFHSYVHFNTSFDTTLQNIERIKSVTSKPLIMTETSVIMGYDEAPDSPELQQQQVDYLRWLRRNVDFPWLWYSQNGSWRQCGLTRNGYIAPVYYEWIDDPGA